MDVLAAYAPLLPEAVLAIGALALLVYGVFRPDTDGEAVKIGWLALLVMAAAGWAVVQAGAPASLFNGAFNDDAFSRFVKLLVLAGAGGALILSLDEMRERAAFKFELPVIMLFATVGMFLMASAGDLISLYLGLELQSLALYVLAAIRRDDAKASEAGLKYFVLGALSSGMLLYGASLLYGFAGTTAFAGIAAAANGGGQNMMLVLGLVFLLVGIAFKVSAVPFHMWTPDVYEGAPTPMTAFLAAAPKVAAMALFIRVVGAALPGIKPQWQQIVVFLSIASMVFGALGAIGQTNIKRLMAYSSIANMGYALVPLAAGGPEGVEGVLVYMAVYIVMTLGAFACIISMRRESGPVEAITDLSRRTGGGPRRSRGPRAHQSAPGLRHGDVHVLAGRHPAARRLLRQVLRLPACHQGRPLLARRHRRRRQCGWGLLLPAYRQDHVLRRGGGPVPRRARQGRRRDAGRAAAHAGVPAGDRLAVRCGTGRRGGRRRGEVPQIGIAQA